MKLSTGLLISLTASTLLFAQHRESLLKELPHSAAVTGSTIPSNGDLNPYGVAFVPQDFPRGGQLEPGDVLVSNFNNTANLQGTGTAIARMRPNGSVSLFFQSKEAVGLTTALAALHSGFVLVGNTPTTDGTSNTISAGSLIVLDRFGKQVTELKSKTLLDGPWDLAVIDRGAWAQIFVSNVLSGTVTRLTFQFFGDRINIVDERQIASGYGHRPDPAALVVGPTGLAYDCESDTLFVASTDDNEIFAVPHASETYRDRGRGYLAIDDPVHLHGPLGLLITPSRHLIVANGDAVNFDPNHPSELEEYSRDGAFLASFTVDATPGGAFGIAISGHGDEVRFAAVDDVPNSVTAWNVK